MEQVIKFRVIYNGEVFAYERLTDNGWEWMVLALNPIGEERWISGGVLKDSHKLIREQFTGLTDKHGKEIYCGDIVQDEEMGKAIVVFQSGCYFMKYDSESNMGFLGIKEDRFGRLQLERIVEIIGNIHQNSK